MYVVLTRFRGTSWVPAVRAESELQADHYADLVSSSRHESVEVVKEQDWDRKQAMARLARQNEARDAARRRAKFAA